MRIRVFCTGGTIDKVYFDAKSQYEVGTPALATLIEALPISLDIQVTSLMAKDSLDMTDADRALIKNAIAKTLDRRIVITHGTDTMTDTAQAIGRSTSKTVVFTGALQPALFKDSDAAFNLGGAFAAAQILPAGIYLVMNGQVFDAFKVRKDHQLNRFVAIDE